MGISDGLRRVSARGAKCAVIVVAAGKATRMQGTDKVLAALGGETVLVRALQPFEDCAEVKQIIVVTRAELLEQVSELCVSKRLGKVSNVVKGGDSRAESVQAGLACVDKTCQLVAIHDGARPLVTERVIHDAIRKAAKFGAAAPALAVTDTIKIARGGVVETTCDRSNLYAMQTPQVFKTAVYKAALQNALEKKLELTDDCSAAEAFGLNVVLTPGSEENIKITTPTDLRVAEAILAGRTEK